QFKDVISTVLEKLAHKALLDEVPAGATYAMTGDYWYLFVSGTAVAEDRAVRSGEEFGWRPFTTAKFAVLHADSNCIVIKLQREDLGAFLTAFPSFPT